MARLIFVHPDDKEAVTKWAEDDDKIIVAPDAKPNEIRIVPLPIRAEDK